MNKHFLIKKFLIVLEKVYDFMLPSSKQGVIAFEISIELVKKRYYVVFIKEHAEKGYFQSSCPLYSIFDRKNFTRQKNRLEEIVLELCIEYDYPIGLATFLLIMCNQDLDLLKRLMDLFLLARSKQELNILISNEIFSILASCSTDEFNLEAPVQGVGYVRKFRECFLIDNSGNFTESVLLTEYVNSFIKDEYDSYEPHTGVYYDLQTLEK